MGQRIWIWMDTDLEEDMDMDTVAEVDDGVDKEGI